MRKTILFIAASVLASFNMVAHNTDLPEAYKVGEYEVYVLTENSGTGNTGILIDAPETVLKEYAPQGIFPNAVNAILIKGKDEIWLADTGFGRHIFDKIAALGVTPQQVDHVLLTHMHGDHIGGMFRDGQKSFPNARVIVSEKEYDYWSSEEEMNKVPENRRGSFFAAQKVFSEYEDLKRVEPVSVWSGFANGITPVAAYGHTPGHILFMVKDNDDQLLIWGDLTHAMAVQMPHPEISVTYDVDPDMARKSRLRILAHIADKNIAVVGMHVPAVHPGTVHRTGDNSYKFEIIR